MAQEFPTIVYRSPGKHHCKGGGFDYRSVSDKSELDASLKSGWHETLEGAIKGDTPAPKKRGRPRKDASE